VQVFSDGLPGGKPHHFGNPEAPFSIQDLPQEETERILFEKVIELLLLFMGKSRRK
jgi:hypothetical protein